MCVYTLTLGGVRCSTGSQKQERSSAIVIRKSTHPLALAFLSSLHFKCCGCYAQCPNPQAGREKASKTMQLTKREVYC